MGAQIIQLPSGRTVLDTGKVKIGLLASTSAPRDIGTQAERVQTALLSPAYCARRGDMQDREDAKTLHARGSHDLGMRSLRPLRRPSVIHLDTSLLARLLRAVQRLSFRSPR